MCLREYSDVVAGAVEVCFLFVGAYLIFVIFFTQSNFLENKIYTEKRQFFALNL